MGLRVGWAVLVFDFNTLAMLVVVFIGELTAKSGFTEEPGGQLRANSGSSQLIY